jgi:hypothetical protein
MRPSREHAGGRPGGVAARTHCEHIRVGAVQPGEGHELVAALDPLQGIEYVWLELDPGIRRAFVPQPRRLLRRVAGEP